VYLGPDRVLDADAPPPVEHTGVDQFVQHGPELTERRAILPGPAVPRPVVMLLWQGVRGREQPRLLPSEVKVCDTDRPEPAQRGRSISVSTAHPRDASGHARTELAHGRCADCREKLVMIRKVTIGGVGHHAHHPGGFSEHHGVRASGPGELEPGRDQAVADGAPRTAPPVGVVCFLC
jgi:hypothetical protein